MTDFDCGFELNTEAANEDEEFVPSDHPAVTAMVAGFNERYFTVNEAGKPLVYSRFFDKPMQRNSFYRSSHKDFIALHCADMVQVATDRNKPVLRNAAAVWLRHPAHRDYPEGVAFSPTEPLEPGWLNLWEGFAVHPMPGDWSLMRAHIRANLCCNNDLHDAYLVGWMATLMQDPGARAEVAVVMRGEEGTGKGTLAAALLHIIGQHSMAISDPKHLVGNFNAHLRQTVLLHADEAFFAGDKAHTGALKALITEDKLVIEGKYANAVVARNHISLIMSSNESWVIPAGLAARRFFMLNVSSAHQQDKPYFAAILRQMQNGGYAAMLHDLLSLDIATFDIRSPPITAGLNEQKKLSGNVHERWWTDVLYRGYVFSSEHGHEHIFGHWTETASFLLLYNAYQAYGKENRERHLLGREAFDAFMLTMANKKVRLRDAPVKERREGPVRQLRPRGLRFGPLSEARTTFCARTTLTMDWPEAEDGPAFTLIDPPGDADDDAA